MYFALLSVFKNQNMFKSSISSQKEKFLIFNHADLNFLIRFLRVFLVFLLINPNLAQEEQQAHSLKISFKLCASCPLPKYT